MPEAPSIPPAPHARRKRVSGVVVPNQATRTQRILAWLIFTALQTLAVTVRIRLHDPHGVLRDRTAPAILALWHNRLALALHIYRRHGQRGRKLAALVSASKDGALLAAILERAGAQPVRGSSSRRGAQALVELNSAARDGRDIAITPDGPRGPCYQVQAGVIALAQVTGLPIVPCTYELSWKLRLKSWDRFQVPLPFARCDVFIGEPLRVPRDTDDATRDQLRAQLQTALLEKTPAD
jgi:lysophospholipid acyltransferase (LPLAT)-like uncharacterized protein